MSQPFQFKQFNIQQDRCGMKIGTDGVLLGAWASLEHKPNSILDIGAGTGVIALMLAQRSNANLIDALEIDADAYEQASENFENSDWNDRLFCYHASFEEFVKEMQDEEQYDLIVSNPPFYTENNSSENISRNRARFTESLPFENLLNGVSLLLAPDGKFNVIIPRKEEAHFIELAAENLLFPSRITRIKGNEAAPEKRSLIEFGFKQTIFQPDTLIIEISRNRYTEEYRNLVADFYLKM